MKPEVPETSSRRYTPPAVRERPCLLHTLPGVRASVCLRRPPADRGFVSQHHTPLHRPLGVQGSFYRPEGQPPSASSGLPHHAILPQLRRARGSRVSDLGRGHNSPWPRSGRLGRAGWGSCEAVGAQHTDQGRHHLYQGWNSWTRTERGRAMLLNRCRSRTGRYCGREADESPHCRRGCSVLAT